MLWLRRVRGVIGTALTWGVAFGAVGLIFAVAVRALGLVRIAPGSQFGNLFLLIATARFGIVGGACGILFALIVISRAHRQTLHELSTRKFAVWGFIAGAIAPAAILMRGFPVGLPLARVLLPVGVMGLVFGAISSAIASATLRAARGTAAIGRGDEPTLPRTT